MSEMCCSLACQGAEPQRRLERTFLIQEGALTLHVRSKTKNENVGDILWGFWFFSVLLCSGVILSKESKQVEKAFI